jgi:hypothetical protein
VAAIEAVRDAILRSDLPGVDKLDAPGPGVPPAVTPEAEPARRDDAVLATR